MTALTTERDGPRTGEGWRRLVAHPAFGFVVVGTVFVVLRIIAVWGRAPELFPDSATYRVPDEGSPFDVLDFTGNAPRAWVLPLFYRVLPNDTARIAVQVALSLVAWLGLAGVLASVLRTRVAQWVAFLSVLALASTQQVTTWDVAVLAESMALSLSVGAVAAWIRLLHRSSTGVAVLAFGLTGAWMLLRPFQFPLALVAIGVCLGWALRRDRRALKLVMAGGFAVVLVWSLVMSPRINEAYRQRDGYGVSYFAEAFGQNFFKRYLADPEAEAWFRARGMPDDAGMSSPSASPGSRVNDYDAWSVFYDELRARPDWMEWLENDARSEWTAYVRSHPGKVAAEFVDELPIMLRAHTNRAYGAPVQMLPGPLDRLFFWGSDRSLVGGDWGLWGAICIVLAVTAALRRARPSWPLVGTGVVVMALSGGLLLQIWLGSAYEKVRHAVPSTYLLRIGLIVVAVALLDALLVQWRARRTRTDDLSPTSGSGSGSASTAGGELIV